MPTTKRRYRVQYFANSTETDASSLERVPFDSTKQVSDLREHLRARYGWDAVNLAVKESGDGKEYCLSGADILEEAVGVEESK